MSLTLRDTWNSTQRWSPFESYRFGGRWAPLNTLSISNNLCGNGCTMLGNLPVLVQGGGSITLSNPILNLTGNHLNIAPGSAVITVTGGSQVKQTA